MVGTGFPTRYEVLPSPEPDSGGDGIKLRIIGMGFRRDGILLEQVQFGSRSGAGNWNFYWNFLPPVVTCVHGSRNSVCQNNRAIDVFSFLKFYMVILQKEP